MKITAKTPILLYTTFSSIPLDIEGSNIDCTGWIPSAQDKDCMPKDVFESEQKKRNRTK